MVKIPYKLLVDGLGAMFHEIKLVFKGQTFKLIKIKVIKIKQIGQPSSSTFSLNKTEHHSQRDIKLSTKIVSLAWYEILICF